jgi:ribosomal protein S18 acetylase RimI-like enzyme
LTKDSNLFTILLTKKEKGSMLDEINIRNATYNDYSFGYFIKKITLKEYIEKTWGWNTEYQKNTYRKNFHTQNTYIIEIDKMKIGLFEYEEKSNYFEINQIFILPKYQNKGIGSMILNQIINKAKDKNIAIKLQVLKINKEAKKLYIKLGFTEYNQTNTHILMKM